MKKYVYISIYNETSCEKTKQEVKWIVQAHYGLLVRAKILASDGANHRPHAAQGIWKA